MWAILESWWWVTNWLNKQSVGTTRMLARTSICYLILITNLNLNKIKIGHCMSVGTDIVSYITHHLGQYTSVCVYLNHTSHRIIHISVCIHASDLIIIYGNAHQCVYTYIIYHQYVTHPPRRAGFASSVASPSSRATSGSKHRHVEVSTHPWRF